MSFVPISVTDYIKKHLENNPSEDKVKLKNSLKSALADYQKGIKCSCGI